MPRPGPIAAAAELGASPSFVSKRMAALEAALGTRLLHRTTRRIALTDQGRTVHRWAQCILTDVDDMAGELAASGEPRGILRVSASPGFGRRHVAPALAELARRYPKVEIRLEVLDRPVDPAGEGYDVDSAGTVEEAYEIAERMNPAPAQAAPASGARTPAPQPAQPRNGKAGLSVTGAPGGGSNPSSRGRPASLDEALDYALGASGL